MFLRLLASIGLNTTGFETGLKRTESAASKTATNLSNSLKGKLAAAFGAGAIAAAARNSVHYAQQITSLSDAMGISTSTMQGLDHAAKQSGGSVQNFAGAMADLAKNQSDALHDPEGGMAEAFARLNISLGDLKKGNVEDTLLRISDLLHTGGTTPERLADLFKVMGKLDPAGINALQRGLRESTEEARSMGLVMRDDILNSLVASERQAELLGQKMLLIFGNEKVISFFDAFLIGCVKAGSFLEQYFGKLFSKDRIKNFLEGFANMDPAKLLLAFQGGVNAAPDAWKEANKVADAFAASLMGASYAARNKATGAGLPWAGGDEEEEEKVSQPDFKVTAGTLTENQRAGAFTNANVIMQLPKLQEDANKKLQLLIEATRSLKNTGGWKNEGPDYV
jgi:hypothetical protein